MRRFQVRLLAALGAAGLLLACLGIYGVLSAMVEGRRAELAIRLALGAQPSRIGRLIVRQGLTPVIVGLGDRSRRRRGRRAARRFAAVRRDASAPGRPRIRDCRRPDRLDRRVPRARRPRRPHTVRVGASLAITRQASRRRTALPVFPASSPVWTRLSQTLRRLQPTAMDDPLAGSSSRSSSFAMATT